MKYRKRPVEVEAWQWHGHDDIKEGEIVRYFRSPSVPGGRHCDHCRRAMHDHGWIDTLEGGHIVCPGDWIITGIKGEHYPCKPDIFSETYEEVNGEEVK